MREALGSGERFFSTPYLFAPYGTDLTLHTHTALNAFAGATMFGGLSPLAALNITILLSLFLNGFCAYLLAWRITRDIGAALVAGLVFGGSPYLAAHLNGHFNLTSAWTLPLFALAVRRCVRRCQAGPRRNRRRRDSRRDGLHRLLLRRLRDRVCDSRVPARGARLDGRRARRHAGEACASHVSFWRWRSSTSSSSPAFSRPGLRRHGCRRTRARARRVQPAADSLDPARRRRDRAMAPDDWSSRSKAGDVREPSSRSRPSPRSARRLPCRS